MWGVLTFRYTAPARAGNGGRGHGCCPVPIRPTQWLTRPNGAVLSPPAGRRSSLCQQHRDPGIEWTCISSLCPSASRPSKVGPGCRPELQPAYSRTRCLPHPRVGKTVSPAVCCRRSQLIYRTAARRSNFIFSVKISIPLENTGVSSVFATSVWPFSLIFSLVRRNEGNFFQAVPTTLSSSLAEVRLASLVAWA